MSLATFSPHRTSNADDDSSSSSPMVVTIGQQPQQFLLERRQGASARNKNQEHWFYILPVLLLEFLAIGLTRAVLPSILLQEYGHKVYLVLGSADCIRGLLAFFACPLFGKLSDLWGRKHCLLITVLGSCAPVCSLALFPWHQEHDATTGNTHYTMPASAIPLFVILLSISGIFSSTFTLVFAYISDTVHQRNDRVSAFGLALACFGLSFTIGPMAGGYLAQSHTHYVFTCSFVLTILDLLYIQFVLPESLSQTMPLSTSLEHLFQKIPKNSSASTSTTSTTRAWSPLQSVKFLLQDPFLRKVGEVAFFYYTGVWAVISTLSLYAVQRFHLSPERLGELMSALGLCTMLAEAVLVRVMIPWVGEKKATQIGLVSFALQCFVLGGATEAWHLFVCVGFSLLGNLVYPSLSSLVSGTVGPESNGEALGAINGVKALTEGIGPLIFGGLMTISEDSDLPGWPYWIAGLLVLVAYRVADGLPDDNAGSSDSYNFGSDKDFVYELQFKQRRHKHQSRGNNSNNCLDRAPKERQEEEYQSLLLSEIEEESVASDNAGERKVRMPFQDLPQEPLDLDAGNSHIELPQFALPPTTEPAATTTTATISPTKPKTLFPSSLGKK